MHSPQANIVEFIEGMYWLDKQAHKKPHVVFHKTLCRFINQ